MGDALDKLRKLRGRGPDELRVRGAQAAASLAERARLSAETRLPTDRRLLELLEPPPGAKFADAESLLEHFRTRRAPAFFASFENREATRAELRRRFGGAHARRTVELAESIREGRFSLLGYDGLSFGDPPDWHLEPVAGVRAPLRHWSRIDFFNPGLVGDKKIVWELNRCQHFITLGRAYWQTGDERFADAFAAQLSSWMDANPPKLGVNWASSLEVAFRAISWLWSLHLFKDSPRLAPGLFARALKFLRAHARHVETYLSTYFSPNTHLTGEALGLYYLGAQLPEFREAARWRAAGRRVLLGQLGRHVRADGTYFEQSTYYARYTADFYTHFLLLARACGDPVDAEVAPRLTALLDCLAHFTRPDGTTPFFGDDDGGRLAPLDERAPDDFRATLSTAAALFGRADYKFVAGGPSEETLWLLGAEGPAAFDRPDAAPPAESSRAFTEGGFYVMRDGWSQDSNFMLIDCGPHGAANCGHAHADALSFDLSARGRALVVDPGTYTYTGSIQDRNRFRASTAHNALSIDGESSSAPDPARAFAWLGAAEARALRFVSRPRFDFFEGEHDGYARLGAGARVSRSVLFLKGDYWIARDRASAAGAHRYDLNFQLAPGAVASLETGGGAGGRESVEGVGGEGVRLRAGGEDALALFTFGGAGGWRVEDGSVSRRYGARESAPACRYAARGEGAQEFVTFVVPQAAVERANICELEAEGGAVYEVRRGAARDLLLVRSGGMIEHEGIISDFELTWARFDAEGACVELVLVGGSSCALDGRSIVDGERVGWAYAVREGSEWIVETEAGRARVTVGDFAGVGL
jgi:hypothetical protein